MTRDERTRRLQHYHTIIPLVEYHPFLRWDTLPFIIIYSILIFLDTGYLQLSLFSNNNIDDELQLIKYMLLKQWIHVFFFPLVLLSHLCLFFACSWSVNIRAFVGYKRQQKEHHIQNVNESIESWTHCLVIPPDAMLSSSTFNTNTPAATQDSKSTNNTYTPPSISGRMEIVPITKSIMKNNNLVATISYEDIVFRCSLNRTTANNDGQHEMFIPGKDDDMDSIWSISTATNTTTTTTTTTSMRSSFKDSIIPNPIFHRLAFPINLPLKFYTHTWKGHSTTQSLTQTQSIYSNNTIHIHLPPFLELLYQQLLAPFFLFQLFCVLLWSLDEYWYHALFTLFSLILFECTTSYNRLKNLERIRSTCRKPPMRLYVYRMKKWENISSENLVCGDVISITNAPTMYYMYDGYSNEDAGAAFSYIPADLLLLKGGVVVNEAMLTGESVPQMKEAVDVPRDEDGDVRLDMEELNFKRSILFGGTTLVSISNSDDEENEDKSGAFQSIPSPPDDGCLAFVLRTGFETQQGSLIRNIIHTTTKAQSNSVSSNDFFIFILILLLCAIASATYVLYCGWNDPIRNRFKLVLHVIIIITSVVPPELPMELSLAVTASITDLITRCAIFCTEPFRIPLAGMVNTCAFDKTGTLTSDDMVLMGVRIPDFTYKNHSEFSEFHDKLILPMAEDGDTLSASLPMDTLRVMVGCQSLGTTHDFLIGNPLEKAVLRSCKWSMLSNNIVSPPQSVLSAKNAPKAIKIVHRYAFTSQLKRMTVLAMDSGTITLWALSKGAPEAMMSRFNPKTLPSTYVKVFQYHMSLGQRVLAMGYKKVGTTSKHSIASWKELGRESFESDLTFAGFLILECPLKPDSRSIIKSLRYGGHDTVMVTGDAVLTAAHVAREVRIIWDKHADIYELREFKSSDTSDSRFLFVPITLRDEQEIGTEKCISFSIPNLSIMKEMIYSRRIAGICVTGDVINKIAIQAVRKKSKGKVSFADDKTLLLHPEAQATLQAIVPIISVFARHAPFQKEAIIAAFNGAGRITLMCGDGTNDVGALKMAHVGISIVSEPDIEAKQRKAIKGIKQIRKDEKNNGKETKSKSETKEGSKKQRKKNLEKHFKALSEADDQATEVGLGDASVASPFTARTTSIECTKNILQRGRCTLVTMMQIYKILGINCLVNASVLSSLHLDGVKQGDRQLTALGVVVAVLFLFVSNSTPLDQLSPHHPPSSILCKKCTCSILLQFLIHFACILGIKSVSKCYIDPYDPSLVPDGTFNPNTMNTSVFLLTVLATVNTFVMNYSGWPFVQDLRDNMYLVKTLQACYGVLLICVLEIFPPINVLLQLYQMPSGSDENFCVNVDSENMKNHYDLINGFVQTVGFKALLCLIMLFDTGATYIVSILF